MAAATHGSGGLSNSLAGEAWLGAAINLSVIGQLDIAEEAYHEAIDSFCKSGKERDANWAKINYCAHVLSQRDVNKGIQVLREVAETTEDLNQKHLALSDYAILLASIGSVEEALKVGETVFAFRLQTCDPTTIARAYGDLGALYRASGRFETARPLLLEGIRRVREAGIQNMLLDQLVNYVKAAMSHSLDDKDRLLAMLNEARAIAERVGATLKLIVVVRLSISFARSFGDLTLFQISVDHLFHLHQFNESQEELAGSFEMLADELALLGMHGHSAALRTTIGESASADANLGWCALLAARSYPTLCALAPMLVREALGC